MVKSITKADCKKLIDGLEKQLKKTKEIAATGHLYAHSQALGYAEQTIENTIKQLKGDYTI